IEIGDLPVPDDGAPRRFSSRIASHCGPRPSSCLKRVVAICDSFQSFQQRLDSLVEQFACAFSVFIGREDFEDAVELLQFFLDAPDFRQQSLNLEQDGGMFSKRKVMLAKGCDQFRQILNSLLAPDEYLHATRIANE